MGGKFFIISQIKLNLNLLVRIAWFKFDVNLKIQDYGKLKNWCVSIKVRYSGIFNVAESEFIIRFLKIKIVGPIRQPNLFLTFEVFFLNSLLGDFLR